MVYRILQMGLRGVTLMLMMIALFINSEYHDINNTNHFIMSGVYGSFIVVTIGLLIEASLHLESGFFFQTALLALAIILNMTCCVIAFMEFSKGPVVKGYSTSSNAINKAFVSMFGAVIYTVDLIFSSC